MVIFFCVANGLLGEAVDAVLHDECFLIPSPNAYLVCKLASTVSKWIRNNRSEAMKFEEKLLASFDNCISPSENTSQKVARERMWTSYYLLRTSDDYISDWKAFLVKTGTDELSAIFYQYVGDYIFKQLIALKYPVTGGESCAEISETLSYEELNGLRYAAGYVPRAIRKKVTKSGHPLRKDLLVCISQLEETDDVVTDDSQDWINAIDRGGLIHINNDTYELFLAMEKELRNHLKSADPPTLTKEVKDSISQAANVQFFGTSLAVTGKKAVLKHSLK